MNTPDVLNTFNIIAGLISIAAFVFALIVHFRSKQKELLSDIQTINDIAAEALWEFEPSALTDKDAMLNYLQKTHGMMTSIRKITGQHSKTARVLEDSDLG